MLGVTDDSFPKCGQFKPFFQVRFVSLTATNISFGSIHGRSGGNQHESLPSLKLTHPENKFFAPLEITPPKINIEPENDGLEDDFPFPGVYSQVPCSSSQVYRKLIFQPSIFRGDKTLVSGRN